MDKQRIIDFWFNELGSDAWYKQSDDTDALITVKFSECLLQVIAGEHAYWRVDALGSLAEIIVLDQFSRNIYRNTVKAFSQDPQALSLAQRAIELGFDKKLPSSQAAFIYMPFMHSESKVIHQQAEQLFKGMSNYEFELKHKVIIDRFGRYPHRNAILGRESTPEELQFLTEPNSSF